MGLISLKKQKNVQIKKDSIEDTRQREENFKIQLIDELQPEIKEIVDISISMNRQNINRNLIKAFKKYVNDKVKATFNYEKLSAS